MSSIIALEHGFIKVPYEASNKAFRSVQKTLEKEIALVISTVGDLCKQCQGVVTSNQTTPTGQSIADELAKCADRLRVLRNRLGEALSEEQRFISRCRLRLLHLDSYKEPSPLGTSGNINNQGEHGNDENIDDTNVDITSKSTAVVAMGGDAQQLLWQKKRMDRLLVDYLLRQGYFETAVTLAEQSDISDLCDIEIFASARDITAFMMPSGNEDGVRDCSKALAWCIDNKSRLRKAKSTLEFQLRLQEFVELIRAGKRLDAIKYSRKFLAPCASTNLKEIQLAMALLAFPPGTVCHTYRHFFSEDRWVELVEQFRHDFYILNSLPQQPLLLIALQSGISVLKTASCGKESSINVHCPACDPLLNELGAQLPTSHRVRSCIVCRMTGELMNDENPPYALPSGEVYSARAVEMICANNNGMIKCDRTDELFSRDTLKKVFVM